MAISQFGFFFKVSVTKRLIPLATINILPSLFLSLKDNKPVSSQVVNQSGIFLYSWLFTVSIILVLEKTAIAGAVVYKIMINNNAQPADLRA